MSDLFRFGKKDKPVLGHDSDLDADTLDGLHAAELISKARRGSGGGAADGEDSFTFMVRTRGNEVIARDAFSTTRFHDPDGSTVTQAAIDAMSVGDSLLIKGIVKLPSPLVGKHGIVIKAENWFSGFEASAAMARMIDLRSLGYGEFCHLRNLFFDGKNLATVIVDADLTAAPSVTFTEVDHCYIRDATGALVVGSYNDNLRIKNGTVLAGCDAAYATHSQRGVYVAAVDGMIHLDNVTVSYFTVAGTDISATRAEYRNVVYSGYTPTQGQAALRAGQHAFYGGWLEYTTGTPLAPLIKGSSDSVPSAEIHGTTAGINSATYPVIGGQFDSLRLYGGQYTQAGAHAYSISGTMNDLKVLGSKLVNKYVDVSAITRYNILLDGLPYTWISNLEKSGVATGTGIEQEIDHGLAGTPTNVMLSAKDSGVTALCEGTTAHNSSHIYVVCTSGKQFRWRARMEA